MYLLVHNYTHSSLHLLHQSQIIMLLALQICTYNKYFCKQILYTLTLYQDTKSKLIP